MLRNLFGLFRRTRNPPHATADGDSLVRLLERVEAAVEKMARDLDGISQRLTEQGLQIHVEEIRVDSVALDNLTFDIGTIDVEDLGGAMNVGLNCREGLQSGSRPSARWGPGPAQEERPRINIKFGPGEGEGKTGGQ